jgi:hypothetical protein
MDSDLHIKNLTIFYVLIINYGCNVHIHTTLSHKNSMYKLSNNN